MRWGKRCPEQGARERDTGRHESLESVTVNILHRQVVVTRPREREKQTSGGDEKETGKEMGRDRVERGWQHYWHWASE